MGFGPLLIGYAIAHIIAVGLGNYLFAGMLIGGFLMFLGLCELRKYCPTFLYAIIASVLYLLCSFFETAVYIDSYFALGLGISNDTLLSVFDWIEFIVSLILNVTILYGIADLSKRVDYPEARQKAYRNMVFVSIYALLQILIFIPGSVFNKDGGFFLTLLLLVQLIYAFFNLALLFKCYAMICPTGQEDMSAKPSRFAFINKMRKIQDEREQEAIENTKAYLEKKIEKRNQKRNNKTNSKKHK